MKIKKESGLFANVLTLFLGLGVGPILLMAIFFSFPHHLQIGQYKILVSILLVLSIVSTLCLAGLITRILKHPLNQLLEGQKQIRHGNMKYRLPVEGKQELQSLFSGFNKMAEGIEDASQQKQLLAEQRSFTKVASQVTHDLRSPLSTLKVLESLLEEKGLDPAHLKLLKLSCERIQTISENLLAKGRANSTGKISLHEIIDNLVLEIQAGINHPQLIIEKNYEQETILLAGEKQDFQRCLSNIMTNAIEAMHGNGKITIQTNKQNDSVFLKIRDTGPGMKPDILEQVLQGGFTYNKVNGNGIGMTVVKEVVEKYKGKLEATSNEGIGTTFFLTFPFQS